MSLINALRKWMMTFITREDEGLEDKNEDRKATRSEGMGLEESASRALMRQGGGEGCGGRGSGHGCDGRACCGQGGE